MPNIVLKSDSSIFKLKNCKCFFDSRDVCLYPVILEREAFFIRISQKNSKVIIKLEKATKPKITESLKLYMLDFAKRTANSLNAEIVHHNLNITKATDYRLYERYEITTQSINRADWINSLCKYKNINVEIGMGSGEFITDQANRNKNESFIGIEVLNNDFHTALRRFEAANLCNIKAIYYDARAILDRFEGNSVKTVYINFPEPWFKTKRIKHSVLTQKSAKEIEYMLRVNGKLVIITDNYPYAVAAANIVESSTNLIKSKKYSILISREKVKTKYEKKWIKYNRTIYRLEYRKSKESRAKKPIRIVFPIKINPKDTLSKDHLFKILNRYTDRYGKAIVELAGGYSKNPQHIFFSFSKENRIDLLPQSNFVINRDFAKAIELVCDPKQCF